MVVNFNKVMKLKTLMYENKTYVLLYLKYAENLLTAQNL